MCRLVLPVLGLGVWFAVPAAHAGEGNPGSVEFFRAEIAPLLKERCLRCHSGKASKGGLSLAKRATALEGGRKGPAIVPGKPEESVLVRMVKGKRPRMPKGGEPLAPAEVEALEAWIRAGAPWPEEFVLAGDAAGAARDWWSLRPLSRPAVPEDREGWARTPVDGFVAGRLRIAGLSPSKEADRRTLIRRLVFDLHGLAPEPEEVERFVTDERPDAYERLVDRLLASPRYGERWGRHWLDVVHYGETHGYDKDKLRPNAWPYRDYVIRSFNEDKPYVRFVEEQLAGDVLYPDDPQGIVATGFIAAGPWDFVGHVELREGTTDKKIARLLDRDDMVQTAMNVFASTTVQCARCHEHKFDPIPQKDYYRLQAVFAGVERADRPYDPDPEVHRLRRRIRARIARLEREISKLDQTVRAAASERLAGIDAELSAHRQRLAALRTAGTEGASPTNGYHSAIEARPDTVKWVQVDLGRVVPVEVIELVPARPTDFPDTPGFGFPARFRVEIAGEASFERPDCVADFTAGDFPNPGDVPVRIEAGGRQGRFVRVTATRLWKRTGDWVFALAELQVYSGGENVALGKAVTALDSIEAGRWSRRHLVDGYSSRARLLDGTARRRAEETIRELEVRVRELEGKRRRELEEAVGREVLMRLDGLRGELEKEKARLAGLPKPAFVYAAAHDFPRAGNFTPPKGCRPIHVLARGDVRRPLEEVGPGALSILPELDHHFDLEDPADEGSRRAALARWLIDPRNPLTWRSIVNRVWQYHFLRALVDTPNDFGHMGAKPSHPELLDWLAVEFRNGGGSLKRLHRLLLVSATYRQDSRARPDAARADAENRLLWRMNRRRLEAEAVRDTILQLAGALDTKMGGPPARHFAFEDDHSPRYLYDRFDVLSPPSRRRSVYRHIVRSVPDPFMECLDCADPSLLVAKRYATLTAQQALALLNNRFVVLWAERFAERVEHDVRELGAQVERAFYLALGRPPDPAERELLLGFARDEGLPSLCRLLLNLNEFLFVN